MYIYVPEKPVYKSNTWQIHYKSEELQKYNKAWILQASGNMLWARDGNSVYIYKINYFS